MPKEVAESESKVGIFDRIQQFYQEVVAEMKKVTWPTWDELKSSTSVVLIILIIFAAVIYVFDFVFQNAVFYIFKLV